MATLTGFSSGFVDGVELEQSAEVGADFLGHMPVPPICGQAEGAILLLVYRDVVWAFEPDDVIAADAIGAVAAGIGIGFHGEAEFFAGSPESRDVFDLGGDGREMTHLSPFIGYLCAAGRSGGTGGLWDSGLDTPTTDLTECLGGNGRGLMGNDCLGSALRVVVHAFTFTIGRSHQNRAGVFTTARAIRCGSFAPARTIAACGSISEEQRLIPFAAAGRREVPAFGDGVRAHAARWNRRRPRSPKR
jgi:hypothetical protein